MTNPKAAIVSAIATTSIADFTASADVPVSADKATEAVSGRSR
jgi:hypothetical protein